MTELKTLKDIIKGHIITDKIASEELTVQAVNQDVENIEFELKEEAIKDIKEFMKDEDLITNIAVIGYIKWKFNITEEDLKDAKS